MDKLQIKLFPCLNDNYGFLIHDPVSGDTATIDTPEAAPIIAAVEETGWALTQIWNTHHHFDHVGSNMALKEKYGVKIIGPENDKARIPGLDIGVTDQQVFKLGAHDVHVIDTPGHTIGHIVYYVPDAKAAFVGDTIFVLGCGRLFEGTPAQMHDSLQAICALPEDTQLYCAHEYTLSNAAFAKTVEPDNSDLLDYIETAKALREQGIPTVPTTVAMEKKTNPFVRAGSAARLGEIRAAKDSFKG